MWCFAGSKSPLKRFCFSGLGWCVRGVSFYNKSLSWQSMNCLPLRFLTLYSAQHSQIRVIWLLVFKRFYGLRCQLPVAQRQVRSRQ